MIFKRRCLLFACRKSIARLLAVIICIRNSSTPDLIRIATDSEGDETSDGGICESYQA